MRIVTIIIIVILCLVGGHVIGVVVYIAAKRYYYDYIRPRNRFKRLEKLAMFLPAASAKIDRLKKQVKDGTQPRRDSRQPEIQNRLAESVVKIHEPDSEGSNYQNARGASNDTGQRTE